MFLINKYTEWYYSIINLAKSRTVVSVYTEKHHIIPKSLGGDNSNDNLVKLTAREHIICHRLLVKMTQGDGRRKMSHALWAMSNQRNEFQQRYKVKSSTYEILKIQNARLLSERFKGKIGIHTGKKFSDETKQKMSESAKKRGVSKNARDALVAARKGVPPSNKGKSMSDEQREKMRQAALKRWSSFK